MRHSRCKKLILLHLLTLFAFLSCLQAGTSPAIIPQPNKFLLHHGHFTLTEQTRYHTQTPLARNALTYLQQHLEQSSNYTLKASSSNASILFRYTPQIIKKAEGYHLDITPESITITARDKTGFFYGVVTLLQLMDPDIWRGRTNHNQWRIPACHIEDAPRFHWRGMMLDVSRNFFPVDYVKKFIDRMAQYKLNRFHWHLTDDEGWRIEIKHYPLLTKIGATRGPDTKLPFSTFPAMRGKKNRVQSGYYTQTQIKKIVAYAKARNIEIIPEIDLPGHAKAAVTAYPDLLLDPKDKSHFRSIQKIANNTINPAMESTYAFLDNIIREVSHLFPYDYIHLGGDEVPKGAWKASPAVLRLMRQHHLTHRKSVENYFFARMDHILAKYGKKMAGWQEIIENNSKIRKSSLIMAWKSPQAGIKAIKRGYPTVMAPVQYLYFDQQYVRAKREPGHTWSSPVSLKKVYSFNPPASAKGIEACLWSETLLNTSIADYLAWPRTLALAEVAWSKKRNWIDFEKRVKRTALPRLKAQKVHYRK